MRIAKYILWTDFVTSVFNHCIWPVEEEMIHLPRYTSK